MKIITNLNKENVHPTLATVEFEVPRNLALGKLQRKAVTLAGAAGVISLSLVGILVGGWQGTLIVSASILAFVPFLMFVTRKFSPQKERIDLKNHVIVRKSRHGRKARSRAYRIADITYFKVVAYDSHALEARMDAWFRRNHRRPDQAEQNELIRDSGGVVCLSPSRFRRQGLENLPEWEVTLTFAEGEVLNWYYSAEIPAGDRTQMVEFLAALSTTLNVKQGPEVKKPGTGPGF